VPQYLSPGVYVEEVPSGAAPIAGVGTSTAGFIGLVADNVKVPDQPGKFQANGSTPVPYPLAPAGEPQLITSWGQFKNTFGDFQTGNQTLAHAVYGFFNNGGTRCWVTRVAAAAAPAAGGGGGAAGAASPAALSAAAVTNALAQFTAIDEIALVAVPGAQDKSIQEAVISHCENAGDRFALLDGQQMPASLTTEAIKGGTRNSNYAALYYPWISVLDPAANANISVPPSGHLAGIYARVDTERGVHKAPANVVIRGAVDVDRRLSKADQDGLNPDGINVLRPFNGSVTVWGARTLGGDGNGEWKYINIRRLFLFLRESIDQGTQWVVFEPNAPNLWAQITRNVTAFLTNVWHSGALFGTTPQEAFYVKCDEGTNPPEVRDAGMVVTEIGVAVVKPAEFVIFRLSQWAGPGQ
jgi:Bacteriophage tail sheath protein